MIITLAGLALCAALVRSSVPEPSLEAIQDPLDNVRAALTGHIGGLSGLLTQISGMECSSGSGAQRVIVWRCPIELSSQANFLKGLDSSAPAPGQSQEALLSGELDELHGLESEQVVPEEVTLPTPPFRLLPLFPIPPTWYAQLYNADCVCVCTPRINPDTDCCWKKCVTHLVPIGWPWDQTNASSVAIQNSKGDPVRIEAQLDTILFASFISRSLTHKLGLDDKVDPWPASSPDKKPAAAEIIGTVPITLANFTKAELKLHDVFYVIDPRTSYDAEEEEVAQVPDLSIGVELLRQIRGLTVHPDVIVS